MVREETMKENFHVTKNPASDDDIRFLISAVGPLPTAYIHFLRETDGSEYGITDQRGDCIVLWGCREIVEENRTRNIQQQLPNALAIGSDGGDDALLFDCSVTDNPNEWPVVRVDFASLESEEFVIQAASFSEWAKIDFRLRTSEPATFDLPRSEDWNADIEKLAKDFPKGDDLL